MAPGRSGLETAAATHLIGEQKRRRRPWPPGGLLGSGTSGQGVVSSRREHWLVGPCDSGLQVAGRPPWRNPVRASGRTRLGRFRSDHPQMSRTYEASHFSSVSSPWAPAPALSAKLPKMAIAPTSSCDRRARRSGSRRNGTAVPALVPLNIGTLKSAFVARCSPVASRMALTIPAVCLFPTPAACRSWATANVTFTPSPTAGGQARRGDALRSVQSVRRRRGPLRRRSGRRRSLPACGDPGNRTA